MKSLSMNKMTDVNTILKNKIMVIHLGTQTFKLSFACKKKNRV